MMNAWDHAKTLADKHASQGGRHVRLQNDGDQVTGACCGNPHAREVYWDGEKYTDVAPEGGAKASLRVSINFYVPAEGSMKIIEGGTAWFKDLLEVRDKFDLEKWTITVKRRGKKGDPKTKYSILPDKPIDEALRARIAAAGIHDLAAIAANDNGAPDQAIDLETARAIADRLRALPRSVGEAFLAEFKIGRIRELQVSDLPATQVFFVRHEQPVETDPFAV